MSLDSCFLMRVKVDTQTPHGYNDNTLPSLNDSYMFQWGEKRITQTNIRRSLYHTFNIFLMNLFFIFYLLIFFWELSIRVIFMECRIKNYLNEWIKQSSFHCKRLHLQGFFVINFGSRFH